MPQPPPHRITNPKPNPDLAPAEPKLDPLSEKRGLGEGNDDDDEDDDDEDDDDSGIYYASRPRRRQELYAAKPHPPEESWRRPASGPTRGEFMCSNEFLKSVGISPSRQQWDLIYTPENPWQPKPDKRKPRERKPEQIRPPADNQPGPST